MTQKKLTLLIVDDETIIQRLFKDFLEEDYHILKATDGEEALEILNTTHVDVVFSDVHMPKMGGMEVLKNVKEKFSGIPIVMMDSFPEVSAQKMEHLGAFAFIHKPFYMREIRGVLKEVIDSRLSESQFRGANRRKEQRISSVLEISYKLEGIEGHDEEKTLSKNLSPSGILIETSQYLKKGMRLVLKLKLPHEVFSNRSLVVRGDVMWCMEKRKKERYDTGVHFLEDQEEALTEIRKLLGTFFT